MKTTDTDMTDAERDYASAWGTGSQGAQGNGPGDDKTAGPDDEQKGDASAAGAGGAADNAAAAGADGAAAGAAGDGEGEGGAGAGADAAGAAGDGAAAAGGEGAVAGADAAGAGAGDEGGPTDPKDVQRSKSWEGRLNKREQELAEREAKLKEAEAKLAGDPEKGAEAIEKVADKAEAKGNDDLAAAAQEAAEKVESGEISVHQALESLSADFGSDFVNMVKAVATAVAREAVDLATDSKLKKGLEELEGRTRAGFDSIGKHHAMLHREKIAEAYPDVDDIAKDPAFQEFAKSYPDGEQIASGGTARQILKMLKAFHAQKEGGDGTETAGKDQIDRGAASAPAVAQAQPSEAAIDAAAGVRSSGAPKLPDAPAESGDYAGAWAQA